MARAKRPNIVWIMAEDIGPELSCYGYPVVKTPNLDRLAAQGVRFTNCLCTAPVCSPARSGMITGMYQTTIGAHHHRSHRTDGYTLPPPVRPITHILREAGYFTAVGCGYGPKTDLNFRAENLFDGRDWSQSKGRPFFAQLQHPESHRAFVRDEQNPIDPKDVTIPPFYPDHPVVRRDWADYLESIQVMDRRVGEVLDRLERERIADNTVVIFIGDNGRCHVRGKQFLYDGGIHIPLIVRWPGRVKPGTVRDDLVSSIDISAAVLGIAGIEAPRYMQGRDFFAHNHRTRRYVFAARDRCDETVDRIRCVRTKRYKYIRNFMPERPLLQKNAYKERMYPAIRVMRKLHAAGKLTPAQAFLMAPSRPKEELYDVRKDPHEIHNLAGHKGHREALQRLRRALQKWIVETNDQGRFPEPESSRRSPKRQGQKRKKSRQPQAKSSRQ